MKGININTIDLIRKEMQNIPEKYQSEFNSTHEGLAVLWEEFEELKEEVFFGEKGKSSDDHKKRMQEECVQVASMAIRFIQELT